MDTLFAVEPVRVTSQQLIDIVLCHIFEGHTQAGRQLCDIPENIAQLVNHLHWVEVMTLKLGLFQNVNTLSGFTVQTVTAVANLIP